MEADKKAEIIQKAIRNVMEKEDEEEDVGKTSPVEDGKPNGRQRQLLSNLLFELESDNLEATDTDEKTNSTKEEAGNCKNESERILKELKNVKRQNRITHWLVSAMILLTVAWQLSEVSLILRIKHVLSNPLKFVGRIIGRFLPNRRHSIVQGVIKQASEKQKQVIEPSCLPGLKIPHLGLPGLDDTSDEDADADD